MERPRLHNRLAVIRAGQGVSRKALADAVGVNPQTIGYLERGDYGPSLELALRIARHFDAPVELLFSLEPFPGLVASLGASRPPPPSPGDA